MSRTLTFHCDGCDKKQIAQNGNTPAGWACVSISAEGFKGWTKCSLLPIAAEHDLCEECQIHLHSAMQPKNWARDAEAA